jgi:hypothetical protein
MTTFWKVAAIAALAAATEVSWAQDFTQFLAGPSPAPEVESHEQAAPAAYATISDTEGPAYETVAFENENGNARAQVQYLSDAPSAVGAGVATSDVALVGGSNSDGSSWLEGAGEYGLQSPESTLGSHDYAAIGEHGACGIGGNCDADCGCDSCGYGGSQCGSLCNRTCPRCCGVGAHRTGFYGEFLYLRARNADVAYAVPIDGPIVAPVANPLQLGNYGVLDPDYSPGFRGGFNVCLDTVSSIDIRYTFFESLTDSAIKTEPPLVLRSLVAHPSSSSAASDYLSATAQLEIDFDVVDLTYRHALLCNELCSANWVLGARYAKLEQQFNSEFVGLGSETVSTDIDFDGGGVRLGLETERYSCRNQLHVYARGYANFLAGRFRGSYFQGQSFDPTVVNTEWEAGRIVPILDLEAGVGWTSHSGKVRLAGGYMVNAWFNTLTTQEFVQAVQGNDLVDLGQTMTFDGLNARIEYRF